MGILYGQSVNTRSASFAPLDDDPQIIAQWVELCLQTARGTCWSAPDYGLDLRAYVLRGLTDDDLAVLPVEIKRAIEFDERIQSADAEVQRTYTGGGNVALKFTVSITPKGLTDKPFVLTGTANSETVAIMLRGL